MEHRPLEYQGAIIFGASNTPKLDDRERQSYFETTRTAIVFRNENWAIFACRYAL